MTRSYLFLQGPIGPFFTMLAKGLRSRGHRVLKINFNSADRFSWRGLPGTDFKDGLAELPEFLDKVIREECITDIIMFGDSRPVHLSAIKKLKELGLRIHVFEEGYFRPNWITLERDGVNCNSGLPDKREFYDNWRRPELVPDIKFGGSFWKMAWYSMVYYVTGLKGMYGEFRRYKHHFDISPHKTIGLWILRLIGGPGRKIIASLKQREIIRLKYFIVPLQLGRDYQIKLHSQFRNIPNFIDYVIGNFAHNSDKADCLLFKIHPLENNPRRLKKAIRSSAALYGVRRRVKFIDGGHLPTLISHSKGMVVVNSTSALSAMHHKKPVIALSQAIYDFKGLTSGKDLAKFWLKREAPDADLFQDFKNYVVHKTQVNGSYYNRQGQKLALAGALARLGNVRQAQVRIINRNTQERKPIFEPEQAKAGRY